MKTSSLHLRFYIVFIFLFLVFNSSQAQDLLSSRRSSVYTYYFKISNEEAKVLYKKGLKNIDTKFFHTKVDSVLTSSSIEINLSKGHYLKTYTRENLQHSELLSIADFDVLLYNNGGDLNIQVYNLKGELIEDAKVKINRKKLKFDKETKSYVERYSNRKGILEVTYNGMSNYYDVYRGYNNPKIKQIKNEIIYSIPLKYITIPIKKIFRIPKRIKRTYFDNYYYSKNNYKNEKIKCLINRENCGRYIPWDIYTLTALNKPKYFPNDTLKFKTFVVKNKGKQINKPVKLFISNYYESRKIYITTIYPYRKGTFEFEFNLHDSLELKLNTEYSLILELKNGIKIADKKFMYEDYDLKNNKFETRLSNKEQYKNHDFSIFIKATDINDLNLQDARVELIITPTYIFENFEKRIFVPDTLFRLKRELIPYGETEIIIPDSIFPKSNLEYKLDIRLHTTDNELIKETKTINYFHKKEDFAIAIINDSIKFEYLENGYSKKADVTIYGIDNFENKQKIYQNQVPITLKTNPYYSEYLIEGENISKELELSSNPNLIFYSNMSKGTINIIADNPRKIPFIYSIFHGRKLIASGYTDSLNFTKHSYSKSNYSLTYSYLWKGEMHEKHFTIPYIKNQLNIEVEQPKIVYPGQTAEINLKVTNQKDQAIENVDITAFSYTKKFNKTPDNIFRIEKNRKSRYLSNTFKLDYLISEDFQNLNYNFWKSIANIDSIEFYNFLYPNHSIYRFEFPTNDSITQIAPYVINNGKQETVHVIYIDKKPVYFSWSTNVRPYSFSIDSGYHQVELRTTNKTFTIDSLYINPYKKLILSLDYDSIQAKNVKFFESPDKLTETEKQNLYKYIFPYLRVNSNFTFLQNNNETINLVAEKYTTNQNFAGPIHGVFTYININRTERYTLRHEPFLEYEFLKNLIKMRSVNISNYPELLNKYNYKSRFPNYKFEDLVLTQQQIVEDWEKVISKNMFKGLSLKNDNFTEKDKGHLTIRNTKIIPYNEKPFFTFLSKIDDKTNSNINYGYNNSFHNLEPGYYKIVFLFLDESYHIEDSIKVDVNGKNFYEIANLNINQADSFSINLLNSIKALTSLEENIDQSSFNKPSVITSKCSGDCGTLTGKLIDQETGLPVPFGNVIVESSGRQFGGAQTNFEGEYTISPLPPGRFDVKATYVGKKTMEIRNVIISKDKITFLNIEFESGSVNLSEFIVIDYMVPLINKDGGSSGSTVTRYELAALPGRDASSVAITVGGVYSGDGEIVSIRGGQAEGTVMYIDGELVRRSSSFPIGSYTHDQLKNMNIKDLFPSYLLYVVNGSVFTGNMQAFDISILESIEYAFDEQTIAKYGNLAKNGVVFIKTIEGTLIPKDFDKGTEHDDLFAEAAMGASSIRKNFSDYAFWQPKLKTDKDGKASFKVTFPDDVTNWGTYYVAINGKKQTGQTELNIKSYKPLISQLAVPRFLVENDSTNIIGKVLNYTSDSVLIDRKYYIQDVEHKLNPQFCTHSTIDTIPVFAKGDSLTIKYMIENQTGYFDGEIRNIPIFPLGMQEVSGEFFALNNDTTFSLNFDQNHGDATLYAMPNMIDVILNEISHVANYKYFCNEQIASKIKVLIAEKSICEFKNQKFKHDNEIRKLITLLRNNQKSSGLWGWWKNSVESEWISLHVIEALILAEKHNFRTNIDYQKITNKLIFDIEQSNDFHKNVKIIKMLKHINPSLNFIKYIEKTEAIEIKDSSFVNKKLHVMELKQLFNIDINIDSLKALEKTTIFGSIYFPDNHKSNNILSNDLQNTIIAYRILKSDKNDHSARLSKIRNYFLETRRNGNWRNTYESAQIIETILDDLINEKTTSASPKIILKGDINRTITEFPFEIKIDPSQTVELSKTGNTPIYLTTYQKYWNKNPEKREENFKIKSYFEEQNLTAGKEATLKVSLRIEEDLQYVLINIPIPGGCSYSENKNNYYFESHREYFRNETTIFCEFIRKGEYTFEIKLIPRYTGTYSINPAKIELMYYPTFYGNDEVKIINVK